MKLNIALICAILIAGASSALAQDKASSRGAAGLGRVADTQSEAGPLDAPAPMVIENQDLQRIIDEMQADGMLNDPEIQRALRNLENIQLDSPMFDDSLSRQLAANRNWSSSSSYGSDSGRVALRFLPLLAGVVLLFVKLARRKD